MTKTQKVPSHNHSARFKATRKHHSSEAAEDYTELVAELIEYSGEARTCEIARRLGISHVTAIRTIQRLVQEGYLQTEPHRPIHLTAKGAKVAREAKERHKVLIDFFLMLGVPRDIAEIDVEGAEHHISAITLDKIRQFVKAMGSKS